MPRPNKIVKNLTEEAQGLLEKIYREHSSFAYRQRAHAILLSARGYTINQLQDIFAVDRDTISGWIRLFEQYGIEGLKPGPIPGRPPIYTDSELQQLKELVDQEPRRIKVAQTILQEMTGKSSCTTTLKRALKKTPLHLASLSPVAKKQA